MDTRIVKATGMAASVRRQDIQVELVTLRVGHPAPLEAFQLTGVVRLQPAAAQPDHLGRERVQVVDDQSSAAFPLRAYSLARQCQ